MVALHCFFFLQFQKRNQNVVKFRTNQAKISNKETRNQPAKNQKALISQPKKKVKQRQIRMQQQSQDPKDRLSNIRKPKWKHIETENENIHRINSYNKNMSSFSNFKMKNTNKRKPNHQERNKQSRINHTL